MPLVYLAIVVILAGVALWLINRYLSLPSPIQSILNIVLVGSVAIWVLQSRWLWTAASGLRFAP